MRLLGPWFLVLDTRLGFMLVIVVFLWFVLASSRPTGCLAALHCHGLPHEFSATYRFLAVSFRGSFQLFFGVAFFSRLLRCNPQLKNCSMVRLAP